MIAIIITSAIVIAIFIIVFIIYHNKFKFAIIKLDKAEEDINMYLNKKYELLDRTRPIVKKELKVDDFMSSIDNYDAESSNIDNHNLLKSCYNELFKVLDDHEKLLKSKTLVKILDELNDNEEDVIGSIKFYNDTVVTFNELVSSFPSSVVALLSRYKRLEFYSNEKREIFEILNSK